MIEKPIRNIWTWRLVFYTLIAGIFVIGTLYAINFYFSVRGTTEIVIGGEEVVRQLELQDPDLALLLRVLAISIALTMNVFEVVGVLGDIYWGELKEVLDIGKRDDRWVRPSLRVFYVTIFALDVATNLLGLPRPTGAVHATALFLTAVFLSTIEYPFLWWFLPFLALWRRKKAMAMNLFGEEGAGALVEPPLEAGAPFGAFTGERRVSDTVHPSPIVASPPGEGIPITVRQDGRCAVCGRRRALSGYPFCGRCAPSYGPRTN